MDEQEKARLREAGAVLKNLTVLRGKQTSFEQSVLKWDRYFAIQTPRMPQMSDLELQGHAGKFQEAANEFSTYLLPAEEFARLGSSDFLTAVRAQIQDKEKALAIAVQILASRQRTMGEMIAIQNRAMTDIVGGQLESNNYQRGVYEKANREYTDLQRNPGYCRYCQAYHQPGAAYLFCPGCGTRL